MPKKKLLGFTLIELLMVITVMAILFGVGWANYRGFARRQKVISAARQIEGDVKLTQELAISGDKDLAGCDPVDESLLAYQFVADASNDYDINAICEDVDGNPLTPNSVRPNIEIDSSLAISSSPTSVSFFTVGRGTDLTSDMTITVNSSAISYSIDVVVSPSGDIRIVK